MRVDRAIWLLEVPCVFPDFVGAMSGAFALSERPRCRVLDRVVDSSPLEIDGSRGPGWILLFEDY